MFENKRILGIIPARGGSKGIKGKNIVKLLDKELIYYTIDACKKSKYIDEFIVSTDSEKIKEVSEGYGARVPFLRPHDISDDKAKSIDVVTHSIEYLKGVGEEFDLVVLLQPTSPLRETPHIDSALEEIVRNDAESLVGVCEVSENPVLMRNIQDGKMVELLKFHGENKRRQELPVYYRINGALYINKVESLIEKKCFVDDETIPFIMKREDSVDIDEEVDLLVAEYYLRKKVEGNER